MGRPLKHRCNKCGIEKDFNSENYKEDKNSKFGLKKICKECIAQHYHEKYIRKQAKLYNICEEDITDPLAWYKTFIDLNMKQMPRFCYDENNLIKIIRYIAFDKLNVTNEYDLITFFNTPVFKEFRITMVVNSFGGKIKMFKICFPEFSFNDVDNGRKYISDVVIEKVIENWLNESNLTIYGLFNLSLRDVFNDEMKSMCNNCFNSYTEALVWYSDRTKLKHPIHNRKIKVYDFAYPPNGYFESYANRTERIKDYCELECKENIIHFINDTHLLKEWIYKYFKSEDVCRLLNYSDYNSSLYDTLVEAYPLIKTDKILFEWEWHQCSTSDRGFLIKMLQEFVLYRLNNIILDLKDDIPKYINRTYILEIEPKLNKHINRGRFKNYYEWCCLSFPEYAEYWKPQDFDSCTAYDGSKCDSKQEMMIFEFIKRDLGLKHIKSIGNKRSGKYIFELDEDFEYEKFCPDFVIEYLDIKGKKEKLKRPIILEYYGMYDENHKHIIFKRYTTKTKIKNKYYKSNEDIYFIPIYPEDIKNNFENLVKKLSSFLLENFNYKLSKISHLDII